MNLKRRQFLEVAVASTALTMIGIKGARAASDPNVIRIGIAAGGPRTSDPNLTTQGGDNWATEQMYEQLVRPADGTFATAPDQYLPTLATEWKMSPDAKTWTFKLREGVQFHKGYGEMTADDVVFSYKRAIAGGTNMAILSNIADVVADGPYGVTVSLKTADVNLLGTTIFSNNTSIVSKKAVDAIGAEKFQTDAVGTGPYELTRFDPQWGTAMKRHEAYWGEKAKTPNVECVYMADTTSRTLALLSGDVDMIEAVRAPGWVDSMLQRDPTLIIDMTSPGSFNTLHVNLNRKPFDNLKVRQALMYAIDRHAIADALKPMGGFTAGLQPVFFPAGFKTEDLPPELQYKPDPEKAKALLAEAGFPDGFDFDSNCSQREDYSSIMLIVQEQLRAVGMRMNLKIGDHTAYHADNKMDKNTLALHSSSYPPIPTQLYFQQLSVKSEVKSDGSGGLNYSHYGVAIPGIDDILDKALQSTDFNTYVDNCKKIELQVLRDLPLIGLASLSFTVARNARLDLGYKVQSGYARWRFHRAAKTA
ncbi:ABC transporter substrate-binding protein [Rhizobium leguminosarum bv. viciae]|uniref:ABC transporter substrate-binding protein n=1 Tax=Rhizobium TaxID=379 RepID=UPI0010304CC3|nr:ABC transporter substrate-binding protein [Rhizobium leguminosarum]WSG99552.1 ABC transporter substrate-binding protein [Rhizobium johnstonii]MBY5340499.1 ABC transporter substrate-binding protein [Rhizobium leguminosarum]NKK49402.1 ABC transporter substrate-binding protein [Rhizobium leguminosarum bv. viciae]TBF70788.1 ABC transporter substrate-binding protein [Rhizobium leguminosarum]TBG93342.1 ABC transporter substrate-binding protein [Rhizobium leguminosarum]